MGVDHHIQVRFVSIRRNGGSDHEPWNQFEEFFKKPLS